MLTYSLIFFCTHFFAGCYTNITNITVNSCNTKRISSLEKSLSEKHVHIPGCQKNGPFHIGNQKNRTIHILFAEKRGPIIYLAVLKKGAIRHAHPYYAIYIRPPPPRIRPFDDHTVCTVCGFRAIQEACFIQWVDAQTDLSLCSSYIHCSIVDFVRRGHHKLYFIHNNLVPT